MLTDAPASAALLARARAVTPGGVNSPVRAFRAVGGTPRFMTSGSGAWLTDADGRDYVDLVCSWGPMILGHAHPVVLEAVRRTIENGFSFGTPSENEVALAEEIVARVPPVEQLRLVSSGTEATMSAIRLARGYTGRSLVVKFAGHYHGHVDSLLVSAGSGVATLALPDSAGVPAEMAAETLVVPTTTSPRWRRSSPPVGTRSPASSPRPPPATWVWFPRSPASPQPCAASPNEHGALLVSDEVMTGFRCSATGWWGLEGVDVAPDLMTFGKVMGGGFPAAAFGGRRDVMALLAPDGPVYQAGTLSGNPVATAAGLATLQACDDALYDRLGTASHAIAEAASQALTAAGVPHRVQWAGSMFSVFFREGPVRTYDDARAQDTAAFGALLPRHARRRGLSPAERLRVVVRLRRTRRAGPRQGRLGASRRCGSRRDGLSTARVG